MNAKSIKLKNHLQESDFNVFDFQIVGSLEVFKHSENVDGVTVQSFIAIGETPCTEVRYMIGNCTDRIKQERLVAFINELNCERKLKYFLDVNGNIYAAFDYWASDNDFNPQTLVSIYVLFFKAIIDEGDIRKIMKIIWG